MSLMTATDFFEQHQALLEKAYESCAQAYTVTFQEFVDSVFGHITHTSNSQGADIYVIAPDIIGQININDYCLAIACAKGDPDAWEDFVSQYKAFLLATARSHCQSEVEAQELASSAYAELYGLRHSGTDLRESKFLSYSGRGSLRGWLRAVIYQMAIDRFRERARLVQPESDIELERQYPILQTQALTSDPSSFFAEEY